MNLPISNSRRHTKFTKYSTNKKSLWVMWFVLGQGEHYYVNRWSSSTSSKPYHFNEGCMYRGILVMCDIIGCVFNPEKCELWTFCMTEKKTSWIINQYSQYSYSFSMFYVILRGNTSTFLETSIRSDLGMQLVIMQPWIRIL